MARSAFTRKEKTMFDGKPPPERKPDQPVVRTAAEPSLITQRLRERIRQRQEAGPARPVRCCCNH